MNQINMGKQMLESAVDEATTELFEATKSLNTYWELYAFVKMASTSQKEFNIQMQKAREAFLRRDK